MQRLILIVLSAFFFLATPAFAKDAAGKWIVSQRSGDVRVVHRGLQPASVKANTSLSPGDVVMTGATGRATLARGADYIVVAPRSELRLPAEAQPGGFTRVVQRLGTMLFKVKHTGVPHFAVDTPMLAAVVKGTTFTVIVDKDRSAVQVIEGAVQVVATDGGMQKLVEGGHTVFIDRNNPRQLLFATPQTLGAVGAASGTAVRINGSGDESVSEIASLTTGLVRAEPVPVPAVAPTALALLVNASAPLADIGTLNPDPDAKDTAPTSPVVGGGLVTVPPTTDVLTIVDPLVNPLVDPIVGSVVDPIVESVVDPIVVPIVDILVDPFVAPIVESVVAPIIAPIVETVVTPIVAPIVETVVTPIVAPIVETVVAPIVQPIVAPIVPIVQPIVAPTVAPIVQVLPIGPIIPPLGF
jgi:FecR protein